jgi:hypothetical protein
LLSSVADPGKRAGAGRTWTSRPDHWTLPGEERDLVAGKRGPARLGFALLLKSCTWHGRFPAGRAELPDEAVAFVAKQVKVPASDLRFY